MTCWFKPSLSISLLSSCVSVSHRNWRTVLVNSLHCTILHYVTKMRSEVDDTAGKACIFYLIWYHKLTIHNHRNSGGTGGSSYGQSGLGRPHWPKLRAGHLSEAVCLRHRGKFSLKFLTFGHFFAWILTKSFPLTTPFRLALHALAMVRCPLGIKLANPGSATALEQL